DRSDVSPISRRECLRSVDRALRVRFLPPLWMFERIGRRRSSRICEFELRADPTARHNTALSSRPQVLLLRLVNRAGRTCVENLQCRPPCSSPRLGGPYPPVESESMLRTVLVALGHCVFGGV